ncbi:MAG: ABC transporter ATP-binding protein [Thaumarchaeota archaeon]|nr:ABC transporter ATP-binding protein [Nitrososphaerota archaeon]
MLKVDNVSAGYGKLQVLEGVSMEAASGEVTTMVGPNGSGKSTLLKTIAGLTKLYSGKITLDGASLTSLPPHEIARRGVAYLPQTESVFTQLTVAENVKMAAFTIHKEEYGERLESGLQLFPQVRDYMGNKVQDLSGGERQMVALIMALMRKPKIVMLDEPTANLSPKLATEALGIISSLAKEKGLAVLLVEQNARKALEMGDKAYLLVSGKKAFEGPPKDLLAHKELAKLYLGLKLT